MARVLVVGCGCRGSELARALLAHGHAVRGTTRDESRLPAIEAAGGQSALADPDRLATLMPHLDGISVVCWALGSASGEPARVAALHAERLESFTTKLVDTHVRGLVYEASGSVERRWLEHGGRLVRAAGETYRMSVELVEHDPGDHPGWTEAMRTAVERVLV